MHRWIFGLWCLTAGWGGGLSAQTADAAGAEEKAEMGGKWNPPPTNQPAWTHAATALRFPVTFNDYIMQGVMDYAAVPGDHLVRYLSSALNARGDVFVQKKNPAPKDKEAVLASIHESLIQAVDTMVGMAEAGRYDELKDEGSMEGKIDLWKAEPIPLMVQKLAATRIEKKDGKEHRVPLKIWYGSTVFKGYVILIRHMRAVDTGDKGEADMKSFVESMTRILKDPSLREEVRPAMEVYVKNPLTKEGQEAAKIVLGYLDNSPMVPVLVPQPPLTTWADEMEKMVPNSGSQMLRAYVISGALAALDDKDSRNCLTLACQQVVRVYLEVQRLKSTVQHPGLEDMTKAVERGEVAAWFEKQLAEAAKKDAAK
jgi:hypothetical protein